MTTFPTNALQAKTNVGSSLKLQCVDINAFRIVQKYLTEINSPFDTLPLPDERELKIIIKEIPIDISLSKISEELFAKGYDVKAIH